MRDNRYQEKRDAIERRFQKMKPIETSRRFLRSPSGLYELEVCQYTEGPSTWDYSRGIVRAANGGDLIADIKRNIAGFWHAWAPHANGNEYLLCGEDYQGYQVVNLTARAVRTYFPESGHEGCGFCWAGAYPSPDMRLLAVEGCVYGWPYDLVIFDFRQPDELPYAELARIHDLSDTEGWTNDDTFALTREVQFRKSDGVSCEALSRQEQTRLDSDESLTDHRIERVEIHCQELLRADPAAPPL